MLLKKQDFLEKKQNEEVEIIRKNGTKNKRVSLQALKRKKRLEKQLAQIDGMFCFENILMHSSFNSSIFLFSPQVH